MAYLGLLGFGLDRYRVLVNRLARTENISSDDMAKIFGAPVHATFPNDYLSIHKGLTMGTPLAAEVPAWQVGGDVCRTARRPRGGGKEEERRALELSSE